MKRNSLYRHGKEAHVSGRGAAGGQSAGNGMVSLHVSEYVMTTAGRRYVTIQSVEREKIMANRENVRAEYSVSPSGEKFPIPEKTDCAAEMVRLEKLVAQAQEEGQEIVVVMGVGFVGAVMAAIIADTVDKKTGKSSKFVIGCQRPSTRSYWKIPLLNRGQSPVKAEDPEVDPMIARCVKEKRTLTAT